MASIKKLPGWSVFVKAFANLFFFVMFIFTISGPSKACSVNCLMIIDTVPQAEIFNLKRADVYVIIADGDTVRIRLKSGDTILMNRGNFDGLPEKVRKEISARGDGIFISEEIESTYPGGPRGWLSYLNQTFKYPPEAVRSGIQGTVVVQFIVDDKGRVSNIEAISGPVAGGLREETIRVIKNSGKWNPAIWNGYTVTSYKRQPLTFRLNP